MEANQASRNPSRDDVDGEHDARERRLALLIARLPQRLQTGVRWLRRPSARWVRIPAGVLLMMGGTLAILPVFGLWMIPLGIVLLAEDVPPLRRGTDKILRWIELRKPEWMGMPSGSQSAAESFRNERQ